VKVFEIRKPKMLKLSEAECLFQLCVRCGGLLFCHTRIIQLLCKTSIRILFQHGGVSLEEMIVPYRSNLSPKNSFFDSVILFPK